MLFSSFSQKMANSSTSTTLIRVCMFIILYAGLIHATPTTIQRMIGALRQRDITTSFGILSTLRTVDFNAVEEMMATEQHAAIFDQLLRVTVPTQITLLDDPQFLLTLLAIPVGFSFPLHSRPGLVVVRVLNKGGVVNVRTTDIVQFIDNTNTNTNTNTNVPATVSFLHEDAFGVGEEDCVCRGGICPRREGCVFWVNKKLRDSSASLAVMEMGLQVLTHDGGGGSGDGNEINSNSGDDRRLLILPESAGPREFMNLGQSSQASTSTSTSTSSTSTPTGSSGTVLLLEAFIKDAEQEDMVESTPSLQYYRADRIAKIVAGNKLKVFAANAPMGVTPMQLSWRGPPVTDD